MPPRSTKDTQVKTAEAVAAPAVPDSSVSVPAAEKKPRAPRAKKAEDPASTSAAATAATGTTAAVVVGSDSGAVVVEDSSVKAVRVPPTRDSVLAEHSEIINLLEAEVTRMRDGTDKTSSVKFLRSISRRVRGVQQNSSRVMKQKVPSARRNNNSGFLKPVNISADMARFTGLNPAERHSRVDVTKILCKYIVDHNLQNPADKRTINADPALAKLLCYDAKKADAPLTYPRIQSLLKTHFTGSQTVPEDTSAPMAVVAPVVASSKKA